MDLVRVQGQDVMGTARELGIPTSTLALWLRKAGWVRGAEQPSAPLPEDSMALKLRVAELERQVKRLEVEKEILKKATAYFASHST
jgi:transposase